MKWIALFLVACLAQDEDLQPIGPHPVHEHFEAFPSFSGVLHPVITDDANIQQQSIYKRLLVATDAIYVRVDFFESTVLGNDVTLKITSLHDFDVQWLTQESLEQWDFTSAYFNGDSVVVEVFADVSAAADINVDIRGLVAGEDPPVEERGEKTLCLSYDNRQRNQNRNKDARYVGSGYCSAWLINDQFGCFLTAGHCSAGGGTLQFNVPDSTTGGGVQHPPASRQYTTQGASIQGVNGGVGNDWRVMGTFRNSNTGSTARQAQNAQHTLRTNSSQPGNGVTWQLYGHGSASGRNNLVLKGSRGSLSSLSGSSARYRVSSTGGDSGSAVTYPGTLGNDADGHAVAIHTHGGCTATGGANAGTWIFNSGLQNALRNPRGICQTGA